MSISQTAQCFICDQSPKKIKRSKKKWFTIDRFKQCLSNYTQKVKLKLSNKIFKKIPF